MNVSHPSPVLHALVFRVLGRCLGMSPGAGPGVECILAKNSALVLPPPIVCVFSPPSKLPFSRLPKHGTWSAAAAFAVQGLLCAGLRPGPHPLF